MEEESKFGGRKEEEVQFLRRFLPAVNPRKSMGPYRNKSFHFEAKEE